LFVVWFGPLVSVGFAGDLAVRDLFISSYVFVDLLFYADTVWMPL